MSLKKVVQHRYNKMPFKDTLKENQRKIYFHKTLKIK
tara:strand:+ start:15205 stop:15315 length:111 start_codon:yes stop_codon:yes gene_type:complete